MSPQRSDEFDLFNLPTHLVHSSRRLLLRFRPVQAEIDRGQRTLHGTLKDLRSVETKEVATLASLVVWSLEDHLLYVR